MIAVEAKTETKTVYTITEVAKLLGCSRNLAYKLAREKKLPGCIHIGDRRMCFSAKAINALLEGK